MNKETVKEIFKSPALKFVDEVDHDDLAHAVSVLSSFRAAFTGTSEEENFNKMLADMNLLRQAARWALDGALTD